MAEALLVKLPSNQWPRTLTDDKSALVQVMAWCCQATNHYPNQCWPRSIAKGTRDIKDWEIRLKRRVRMIMTTMLNDIHTYVCYLFFHSLTVVSFTLFTSGPGDWAGCAGISLSMHPANERRRYMVTTSLIGWVHNLDWSLLCSTSSTYDWMSWVSTPVGDDLVPNRH